MRSITSLAAGMAAVLAATSIPPNAEAWTSSGPSLRVPRTTGPLAPPAAPAGRRLGQRFATVPDQRTRAPGSEDDQAGGRPQPAAGQELTAVPEGAERDGLLAAFDRFTAATDAALSDKRQIDELVTLFAYACRARLKPDGGVVVGQGAVKRFLTDLLVADYPNGVRRAVFAAPEVFDQASDEAVGFHSLGFVVRTSLELLPTAGGEAAGAQQFNLDVRIKAGGVFGYEITSVEVLELGGGATKEQK